MGRKQDHKAAKREANVVAELCRVQKKYILELFDLFESTPASRNQSYITYTNRMMLGQMFFKGIAGIASIQGMTQAFNDKKISKNLSLLMGCTERKYLPHHVTENE